MHVLRPLLIIFQFFVHCGQLRRKLYNPAIFMLYHGKNKLIFNEMMIKVRFELDQHDYLNFYSASSLKQQSADRHVAPLGDSEPPSLCSFYLILRA